MGSVPVITEQQRRVLCFSGDTAFFQWDVVADLLLTVPVAPKALMYIKATVPDFLGNYVKPYNTNWYIFSRT